MSEKVEVQVDETVFDTPFEFSFRPMKRSEGLFHYIACLLDAFDAQRIAHLKLYGLAAGTGKPFGKHGKLKKGDKWVKRNPVWLKFDGPTADPPVPSGGDITVTWPKPGERAFK